MHTLPLARLAIVGSLMLFALSGCSGLNADDMKTMRMVMGIDPAKAPATVTAPPQPAAPPAVTVPAVPGDSERERERLRRPGSGRCDEENEYCDDPAGPSLPGDGKEQQQKPKPWPKPDPKEPKDPKPGPKPKDPKPPGQWKPTPIGERCSPARRGEICLSLKYVAYTESRDSLAGVDAELQALQNMAGINDIWKQCGIGFQIDDYERINPADFRLRNEPREHTELDRIRRVFRSDTSMLVAVTGRWDRRGSLGNSWANAWTAMPGDRVHGVVLEQPVARHANLVAHELGHYVSLDHSGDAEDVMSPLIYPVSLKLTDAECASARWAARHFWKKMRR